MPSKLPYGSWPSTISANDVAAGTKPLGGACFHGQNVIVQEGRPAEGGRITLVSYPLDQPGEPIELISKPYNVRSRVHEYGGASWKLVIGRLQDAIVFTNFADQRVYLQQLGQVTPIALTPDSMSGGNPQLRFAEFIDGPNRSVLAIMEDLRSEPVHHHIYGGTTAASDLPERKKSILDAI